MSPGSRPPLDEAAAPEAVKKLVDLAFHADDPRVSEAITVLMDRLFGRPAQQISADINIGRVHLHVLTDIQERQRVLELTAGASKN